MLDLLKRNKLYRKAHLSFKKMAVFNKYLAAYGSISDTHADCFDFPTCTMFWALSRTGIGL